MKKISLTQNKFTLIDEEDYDLISKYKWCAAKHRNNYYAIKSIKNPNKNGSRQKTIFMHRLIMNINNSKIHIDHIDGNGLNNQKNNLRLCTNQQNQMNQKKLKTRKCSSKYKGVCWYKKNNKWMTRIRINGQRKHLGYFDNEKLAAIAYNNAAIKLFGEFAKLNFIND